MLESIGTVVRQIPPELILGVMTGNYSTHGGVIRNASGQIVAHLMAGTGQSLTSLVPGVNTLSSLVANGQLALISRDVHALQSSVTTVLNIASANAALSGMGLVVSVAGFAYLNKRLVQVEKLVSDVKELIEARYTAELKAAIGHMKNAEDPKISYDNKRSQLLEAQKCFSALAHLYGDLFTRASEPAQLRALESFFTLCAIGSSISNSGLGMHDIAVRQYEENLAHWRNTTRKHLNERLLGENPKCLLEVDSAVIGTKDIVDILDFAQETNRGFDWLDEFRKKESHGWGRRSLPSLSELKSKVAGQFVSPDVEMIDIAKTWSIRHPVMSAHATHLRFLADRQMSVTDFSNGMMAALEGAGGDAICLLPSEFGPNSALSQPR